MVVGVGAIVITAVASSGISEDIHDGIREAVCLVEGPGCGEETWTEHDQPDPPESIDISTGIPEYGGGGAASPRMSEVRAAIVEEFGLQPSNCRRPGDPQDHGTGDACDWMVAEINTLPSPEGEALGHAIAQFAIDNAAELGVKYVIWQQRIWNIQAGDTGWQGMNDRGSIVENHYDHVHVSVINDTSLPR